MVEQAAKRDDASYQLVDVKDANLPLLDEPVPPSRGQYSQAHTKAWSARIAPFDGFVFVTPEADVRAAVALPFAVDFDADRNFEPTPPREKELAKVFEQVVAWPAPCVTCGAGSRRPRSRAERARARRYS